MHVFEMLCYFTHHLSFYFSLFVFKGGCKIVKKNFEAVYIRLDSVFVCCVLQVASCSDTNHAIKVVNKLFFYYRCNLFHINSTGNIKIVDVILSWIFINVCSLNVFY